MDVETLTRSRIGKAVLRLLAKGMESRFRYRFSGPAKVLAGADIHAGQSVLEVGCGTGFFTVPLARIIGDQGYLTAMDVLPESVEMVTSKVQDTDLGNVRIVKGDALKTGFEDGTFDAVLLFGVIPAPVLPLLRLLPEMHRVLRPNGLLAVWPSLPMWLPKAIVTTGLFAFTGKRQGVSNFRRL